MRLQAVLLLFLAWNSAIAGFVLDGSNPDWMFRPGEKRDARVAADRAARLFLMDYAGKKIMVTSTFDPQQQCLRFTVPTERNGYYTLHLEGTQTTQPMAVIPEPPKLSIADNPFGINFHLDRLSIKPSAREVKLARFIGLGWARGIVMDWTGCLDDPNYMTKLDIQKYRFQLLKDSGMGLLGGIYYIPQYASGAPKEYDRRIRSRILPEDLRCVTEFCRAMAQRVPFITHWEVGNEPDASLFWCGKWKNYRSGNDVEIIRDYVDFLEAAGKGFKAGNPEAKVVFAGLTSKGPEGYTYRPFFDQALSFHADRYCDLFNCHYRGKLSEYRGLLEKHRVSPKPIWLTESGGNSVRGAHTTQIRNDITNFVEQFAAGAERIFKYDFRNDGTDDLEPEHHFGLIRQDFAPKPAYVAYATMIRELSGMKLSRELNLVNQSSSGYLKAFEFTNGSENKVTVLWLNYATKAQGEFTIQGNSIAITDIMGNRTVVEAKNERISLALNELPIFITGTIRDNPGSPVYPEAKRVRTFELPLANPGFESPDLSSWHNTFDPKIARISLAQHMSFQKKPALLIEVGTPGEKNYCSVFQRIDLKDVLAERKNNEMLKITFSGAIRREHIEGSGTMFAIHFFNAKGQRVWGGETSFRRGPNAWQIETLTVDDPPKVEKIGVDCFFCPRTTGRTYIADLKLIGEVWQPPSVKK